MGEKTIRRGRQELERHLSDRPVDRVHLEGGGRPPIEKKEEGIEEALEGIVLPGTAGGPMSNLKWVRSSLRELARRFEQDGCGISPPTVRRLLRKNDYSLRGNVKKIEGSSHPERNKQFEYIEEQKALFLLWVCP